MACIEKMSVRGIRSFSPYKDETIEFYSPLTMIVGANGCGKTTIIESLKYCCTGALPPGARNGQSFVNDPSVTDSTEVKANIKLRFKNKAGFTSVVTRSLQVVKKRSKLEFKALDGVIRSTNAQNEKVCSSQKCSDLDRMIPEMMAVSAPILENVIFCHQEDSNWPMQEGLVLKKKFDDVFESTRYAKALDAISKAKKEFTDKAKDLKVELAEIGAFLSASNECRRELKLCEENQEACQGELETIEDRINRIDEKIKRHSDIVQQAQGAASQAREMRWSIGESERRIADKQRSLEKVYSESDQDLNALLLNFESAMASRTQELMSLQKISESLRQEISSLDKSAQDLNRHQIKGETFQQQLKGSQAKLLQEANVVAKSLDISSPSTWSGAGIRQFILTLRQKVDSIQQDLNESVRIAREAVSQHDQEFSSSRDSLRAADIELENKKKEHRKLMSECDQRRPELSKYSSARLTLQAAERDLEEARGEFHVFNDTYPARINDIKKQFKDASDEIRDLTEAIATDSALLSELNINRNELAAIVAAERQIEQEREQIVSDVESSFGTYRDALEGLETPTTVAELSAVSASLNQRTVETKRQLSSHKDELQRVRSELAGLDALLKRERERLVEFMNKSDQMRSEKDRSVRDCAQQINILRRGAILSAEFDDREDIHPESITIEALVNAAEETEERAYEYKSVFESSRIFLRKLEKARKKSNGACPCCARSMTPDVASAYDENVRKLFNFPDLSGTEEEYKQLHEQARALTVRTKQTERNLQPWSSIQREIDASNSKILELNPRSRDLQEREESLKKVISELEIKLSVMEKANNRIGDIRNRWASHAQRNSELAERKRRQNQNLLSGTPSGSDQTTRSIDDIEESQRRRNSRKDELIAKRDKLAEDERILEKRLTILKSRVTEIELRVLSARQNDEKFVELDVTLKTLMSDVERLESEIRYSVGKREELLRAHQEIERVFRASQSDLRGREQQISSKTNEAEIKITKITSLLSEVEDFERKLRDLDLASVSAQLEILQNQRIMKEEEIANLTPRINAINMEISSQERTRGQVRENLELRKIIAEHSRILHDLSELEKRMGLDTAELAAAQRELERAEQEKKRFTSDRDKLVGNLEIYLQQADELRAKLESPNYRGVDEKYRKKNIQYETTMMAVADLSSYYDALDKALQNFHVLKIKEINKIIRELWQLIYKGQDIDMIELESGQELSDGGIVASRGRRSYNYRVVMRKGDVPLDMRGRCSAGQRVLAAIVIRLALAETFCLNCGILALDEPTTNLDEPNKSGLAHALAKIISSRSRQQNFQLVCITHDEEFVRMMSTELSGISGFSLPEYYFRISREEEGGPAGSGKFFSRIDRIRWDDL